MPFFFLVSAVSPVRVLSFISLLRRNCSDCVQLTLTFTLYSTYWWDPFASWVVKTLFLLPVAFTIDTGLEDTLFIVNVPCAMWTHVLRFFTSIRFLVLGTRRLLRLIFTYCLILHPFTCTLFIFLALRRLRQRATCGSYRSSSTPTFTLYCTVVPFTLFERLAYILFRVVFTGSVISALLRRFPGPLTLVPAIGVITCRFYISKNLFTNECRRRGQHREQNKENGGSRNLHDGMC